MQGLKNLLGSKRFWVSMFGLAGLVLGEVGVQVSEEVMQAGLTLVLALIAAYGLEDIARAAGGKG
ncbi:MAG: hypothetical protein OEY93_04820 [Anaerolineae bacterium]|nr:hypothetical protein [Anaerolineae bacterium]